MKPENRTLESLSICLLALSLLAASAEDRVLSVGFAGRGGNPKGGEDPRPPAFSGAAAVGKPGDRWNDLTAESSSQGFVLAKALNLVAADGSSTPISLTIRGFSGSDYFPLEQGAPVENALLNRYLVSVDGAAMTLSGVVPKRKYDLYLFGSNSRAGAGAGFSVNGAAGKETRGDNEGKAFSEGADFVVFKGIESTPHGELQVQILTKTGIAIVNGLQLVGELPALTERSKLPAHRRWAAANFEGITDERGHYFDEPPLSFIYDGKKSEELLPTWKFTRSSRQLDEQRTERVLTWTDPESQLVVRCVGIEYQDFPAMEWTSYFKNPSDKETAVIEKIQAIDTRVVRGPDNEFILHYMPGSLMLKTDYQPMEAILGPGEQKTLATSGGRSCNATMPYFNLAWQSGGALLAIGWPGQWSATFTRDQGTALQITAGQELTHFRLHPGEEVRGPLIALLFYDGDWIDGQNVWRRWMIAHSLPRYDGQMLKTSWKACSSHQTAEMIKGNEENQKHFIDRYIAEGMKPDYWWMDAGWYFNDGSWVNTGTWEVDTKRFPNGLRAVADYAKSKDVKTLVWFEPERVTAGSWLYKEHPEWLLTPDNLPTPISYQKVWRLLDLGNTEARTWLIDHVDNLLKTQGINLYRQDFNMDPLYFWRANDQPDRQGIREIGHVSGYLAYWDELRRRHPGMPIDSCASGGRRNDLETMRRAIPFVRDDYLFDPSGQQCHTYGLALWLPAQGTGVNDRHSMASSDIVKPFWLPKDGSRQIESDSYLFRSVMLPHLTACFDVRDPKVDYPTLRTLYQQWRSVAEEYYGDYYPLTGFSLSEDVWMVWQFNRPEQGTGIVQGFRRANSSFESGRFKLRGLDAAASYKLTNLDKLDDVRTLSGEELMKRGILLTIDDLPGAVVIAYKKAD